MIGIWSLREEWLVPGGTAETLLVAPADGFGNAVISLYRHYLCDQD